MVSFVAFVCFCNRKFFRVLSVILFWGLFPFSPKADDLPLEAAGGPNVGGSEKPTAPVATNATGSGNGYPSPSDSSFSFLSTQNLLVLMNSLSRSIRATSRASPLYWLKSLAAVSGPVP